MLATPGRVGLECLVWLWYGDPGAECGRAAVLFELRAAPSRLHASRLCEPE